MMEIRRSLPSSRSPICPSALAGECDGWRGERGANLIETAFAAIFLMLLVAIIVDLGGAFQNHITLANAAREGARAAARLPCKDDNRAPLRAAIVDAVLKEVAGTNVVLVAGDVTVSPDPVSEYCAAPGDPVRVTVTIQYTTIFGNILGMAQFPVTASAAMAFAGND